MKGTLPNDIGFAVLGAEIGTVISTSAAEAIASGTSWSSSSVFVLCFLVLLEPFRPPPIAVR